MSEETQNLQIPEEFLKPEEDVTDSFKLIVKEFLNEKFYFAEHEDAFNSVNDLSVIRNVIVHNLGIIDEQFNKDISATADFKLGDHIIIVPDFIKKISRRNVIFIREYDRFIFRLLNDQ